MPEETELRQSAKDAIPDRRSPPWAHNGQTCPVPPPHAEQMSPPAVVGGCFALGVPLHTPAAPPFVLPGDTMLVNASSAIFLAVTALAPSTVWIPSFVCESVPDAARAAGTHARFYAVDEGLTPDLGAWIDEVAADDLVVIVDFFGFPGDRELAAAVRARGALVLEDASQSLLSSHSGSLGDLVAYSPRKFVGVPDGGVLSVRADGLRLALPPLEPPPTAWSEVAHAAVRERADFDAHGGQRDWFSHFQKAESEAPVGAVAMSDDSRDLLFTAFDYATIGANRRANFSRLLRRLGDIALFKTLDDATVPLGFPICVDDRESVIGRLRAHDIYPPVHWPLDGVVPDSFTRSHHLSSRILTLPCDQRYGLATMDHMADIVLSG